MSSDSDLCDLDCETLLRQAVTQDWGPRRLLHEANLLLLAAYGEDKTSEYLIEASVDEPYLAMTIGRRTISARMPKLTVHSAPEPDMSDEPPASVLNHGELAQILNTAVEEDWGPRAMRSEVERLVVERCGAAWLPKARIDVGADADRPYVRVQIHRMTLEADSDDLEPEPSP